MNQEILIDGINNTLTQEFEIPSDQINPEAHLFHDLGLDSLDAVDMLVHLEDQLKVKIDVEQFKEVQTLGDVYKLVGELSLAKAN